MAIRKGNFDRALELKNERISNENREKKERVLALIEKCRPFIEDIVDIVDTYWYVKSKDTEFGEKLWLYLCHGEIDVNSYWGFCAKKNYYASVKFTRKDAVIFYDPDKKSRLNNNDEEWEGVPLKSYLSTKEVSTSALLCYIESLEDFYVKFPSYRDGFFKMIDSYS